jgi:hypothetical protein
MPDTSVYRIKDNNARKKGNRNKYLIDEVDRIPPGITIKENPGYFRGFFLSRRCHVFKYGII